MAAGAFGKLGAKLVDDFGASADEAARIINNLREDEEDFYRDILAREREYARTRSFWD